MTALDISGAVVWPVAAWWFGAYAFRWRKSGSPEDALYPSLIAIPAALGAVYCIARVLGVRGW